MRGQAGAGQSFQILDLLAGARVDPVKDGRPERCPIRPNRHHRRRNRADPQGGDQVGRNTAGIQQKMDDFQKIVPPNEFRVMFGPAGFGKAERMFDDVACRHCAILADQNTL